jgi:DNA ligase-1
MTENEMTLGMDYDRAVSPVGWFVSEKYDGCRGYWDGKQLWTRGGNIIQAHESFTNQLPRGMHLDGEIWCGRGQLEAARLAVQFGKFTGNEKFMVFDAPKAFGTWDKRINAAALLLNNRSKVAMAVEYSVVKSRKYLALNVEFIIGLGGEGAVIRNPKIIGYETGRTAKVLKIKNQNII